MANYKKISELEIIDKPAINSHVLIEENGVLKKTPSNGSIGGGGVKTVVLKQAEYTPGVGYSNSSRICTCESGENFTDIMEYFNTNMPIMVLVKEIYESSAGYTIASKVYPNKYAEDTFITIEADQTFYWTSNNTITIKKPGESGSAEPT